MKINNHQFCQTLNSVRKSNGIKSYLWLLAMNVVLLVRRIMRILNY